MVATADAAFLILSASASPPPLAFSSPSRRFLLGEDALSLVAAALLGVLLMIRLDVDVDDVDELLLLLLAVLTLELGLCELVLLVV